MFTCREGTSGNPGSTQIPRPPIAQATNQATQGDGELGAPALASRLGSAP